MLSLTPGLLKVSPEDSHPIHSAAAWQPPWFSRCDFLTAIFLPPAACILSLPGLLFSSQILKQLFPGFKKERKKRRKKKERRKVCLLALGGGARGRVWAGLWGGVCALPTSFNLPSKLCYFLAQHNLPVSLFPLLNDWNDESSCPQRDTKNTWLCAKHPVTSAQISHRGPEAPRLSIYHKLPASSNPEISQNPSFLIYVERFPCLILLVLKLDREKPTPPF